MEVDEWLFMSIFGIGTETYLYISGLAVTQEIPLGPGEVILPVENDFSLDKASRLLKNDMDFAVAILNSRSIASQLKLVADNSEVLAALAWNAQWDLILLSAVFNCDSISNLQCNCPIEQLTDASILKVTNYQMRGILTQPYTITDENVAWLYQYFNNAKSLLEHNSFMIAVHSMATYRWHSMPRIQLAIIWAGIESLFSVSSEIVFRISLYVAHFLSDDVNEAKLIFQEIKGLYKARSSAVHGGKIKGETFDLVENSAGILKKLIIKCIETKGLPNINDLVF